MDPTIPPSYDGATTPNRSPGLPSYSRRSSGVPPRRAWTEHEFHLASRGSKPPWATLKVLSRSPSPSQLPTFLEGDKITGTFIFNLEKGENITCVRAVAKGQVIPGPTDRDALTFLEVASTLWSKENGDPRNPDSSCGKLCGHYEWPFTLEIPAAVTLAATNHFRAGTFHLPQSYLERRFPTSIQYFLVVHIDRSRFRVNSRVETNFAYVPATRPPPPSALRQLAYQQNTSLLGPEADPQGWEQFPSFTVRGTVFSTRRVETTCHFSLAKPLCYTRGSPIPCAMTMSSTDSQALDLLSAPRAIFVHLRRRLKPIQPASKRNGIFDANADLSADPAENIVAASWWPSLGGAPPDIVLGPSQRLSRRRLDGEIQLPTSLKPSSRMAHFAVEYTVEVLPFKAPAFTSADSDPLLQQRVEIVTMFPSDCPRPRAYAPPQYNVAQEEARDNNYFNADGLSRVWRT
ncbi:hypothetical protein DFH08DRAFT_682183 [Mycena albidolilacea]|uniref:Arrestin-like N-terminal domain-containing protein n=1 Tax=Mycena albidolilacea TaxID=1033008 RepID=A0AAD7AP24_9AGAR|nr:hypothetical protein DFH08DRAFT_682183 [Mycena albidolilacea]